MFLSYTKVTLNVFCMIIVSEYKLLVRVYQHKLMHTVCLLLHVFYYQGIEVTLVFMLNANKNLLIKYRLLYDRMVSIIYRGWPKTKEAYDATFILLCDSGTYWVVLLYNFKRCIDEHSTTLRDSDTPVPRSAGN